MAAAEAAVIRAGHAVADMAYFTARDVRPAEYCTSAIAEAHVYVGIIGSVYGSPVRDRPDLSYSELEFEAATARRLHRLIFLVEHEGPSPPDPVQPAEHGARQEAFRRRLLETGVTVAWVTSPIDLELKLLHALGTLRADSMSLRDNGEVGPAKAGLRRRVAVSIALLTLAGAVLLAATFGQQRLQVTATSLYLTSGLLTFAALALSAGRPMLGWLRAGARNVAKVSVDEAAEALSRALAVQWAREEERRRVNDPEPLPVRWAVTAAAEAAMIGVNWRDVGFGGGAVDARAMAAEFHDIREVFVNRLPSRRLVILGQAGAGKSILALRLARDLLSARERGDLVPVMLPLAAWDPADDLHSWVARQLVRDHPGLDGLLPSTVGRPISLASALVTTGRLLLILDGFDEVAKPSRHHALARINSLGGTMPLVVTSRTDEYQDAVRSVGRGLARVAAIELAAIDVATIKAYLTRATAAVPAGRWDGVFANLDLPAPRPIAEALQTPLMVWLARTMYEGTNTTPHELIDAGRFSDRSAVENHLLDGLVPAVYGQGASHSHQRQGWNPEQVTAWLRFVARWLQGRGTYDLAWWQLSTAVSPAVLGGCRNASVRETGQLPT